MRVSARARTEFVGKEILKVYISASERRKLNMLAEHAGVEPWEIAVSLMADGLKWRKFKGLGDL